MTKKELWAEVTKVLKAHKAKQEIVSELEILLAPKVGGISMNPPKLDDEGNEVEAWCRWHNRYEPIADMVLSNGKAKNYCKASSKEWNRRQKEIKTLNAESVKLLTEGKFDEAQKVAKDALAKKALLNDIPSYDYDKDWEAYNANNRPKVIKITK